MKKLLCILLISTVLSGCRHHHADTLLRKIKRAQERNKHTEIETTLKAEGNQLVCSYHSYFDYPLVQHEELLKRIDITFMHDSLLKPEAFYLLPHKQIIAFYDPGYFWEPFNGEDKCGDLLGTIRIKQYEKGISVKLALNLIFPYRGDTSTVLRAVESFSSDVRKL